MPQEDSRNSVSRFWISGAITSWNALLYLFVRSGKKEDTSQGSFHNDQALR
jgi:hypothetical protein